MSGRGVRRTAALLGVASMCAGAVSGARASGLSCPTFNPPSELVLMSGTPQSAQLGTPFQSNLQVRLDAANGCPITTPLAGVAVTFSAPGAGPSGTFSASGSNAVLVGTDASGVATAPTFTANSLAGGYLVTASSVVGSVTFSLVNTRTGVPASIELVSPASETAVAGARFGSPLLVRVLDGDGVPVSGAQVSFQLGGGGAAPSAGATFVTGGAQAIAATGADGVARSPAVVANDVAGSFTATAAVDGAAQPAIFSLTNLRAKPPRIVAVGAARRTAVVGRRYNRPLEVVVRGADGKPVANADVTFALGAPGAAGGSAGAGASFAGGAGQAIATTNAAGIARSPSLSANTTAGTFTATATEAGATEPATFTLRNRAATAAAVTAGAAASESTRVGTRFPVRLAVTVTDAYGNAVAGAVVRFTAPATGPGGVFVRGRLHMRAVRVKTNASGVAVAPAFVANGRAGGYAVAARTAHATSAAFALVNLP